MLFRNEFAYIIEQAIESAHLTELLDSDLSSEEEMEKQEIILANIFHEHLNAACLVERQQIKNHVTTYGNALSVCLEVLSPPPRRTA